MKNGNPINLMVYPTSDAEKSRALFKAFLGVDPYVDGDYYIGFRVGDQEIGLDPNASTSEGPTGFVETADIQGSLKALVEAGAEVVQDPTDVGGGLLVARLKDADGNPLGLRQSAE
jgi:predicted enzyme related to lactoylglutathione lyase